MTQQQEAKKEALYELAEIGEKFGPTEIVVDDHKIKSFAFMQDDYRPWHFDSSPFDGRIGHATILANDLLQLYHLKYAEYGASKSAGLHTQEEFWFHSPVFAGERTTLKGEYVDKYEKRGKGHVVMDADARGEDGRVLVRHRGVEIMRTVAGSVVGQRSATEVDQQVSGAYSPKARPADRARVGIVPGTPIQPLYKKARPDQMSVFSMISDFSRNIHTDMGAAEATGLRLPIMQAQQQACFIAEMLTNFFGSSWFISGWQKLKFISPVYAYDDITMRGVVVGDEKDESGTRIKLDVWVENQEGQMTAVGWASAMV